MNRIFALLLCAALCFGLSGCMGGRSIDELLTAPPLTEKQSAILTALQSTTPEQISFVYPATGNNRAAIRESDLDHDGVLETIAFYSVPAQSLYGYIAILEPQENGSFRVSSVSEGLGTDIVSCGFIDSDPAFHVLLVEWSNPGKTANNVAAYSYTDSTLILGFEENCTNLLTLDLDTDGHLDFCYITPAAMEEPFSIKYVKLKNAQLTVEGQRYLDTSVRSVRNVSEGHLADGTTAVFVDEQHQNGMQTEVFLLTADGRMLRAVYSDGYDILRLSQRADSSHFVSRTLGEVTCFPSSVVPFENIISPEHWTYWYTISQGSVQHYRSSYMSSDYLYSLCLPDAWLESCIPVTAETSDGTLHIFDTATQTTLLTLCALSVDEDAADYIEDGFSLVSSNGGFRYYAQFNCSDEDIAFIRSSFFTL
ncbi:MAG: hypothetical protein IKV55_05895 [Oscillospiraceae bacterium]|nr:hypothetical protein [Oscillospiraceae bacterium]